MHFKEIPGRSAGSGGWSERAYIHALKSDQKLEEWSHGPTMKAQVAVLAPSMSVPRCH